MNNAVVTVVRECGYCFDYPMRSMADAKRDARFWCDLNGTQRVFASVSGMIQWVWSRDEDKLCMVSDCGDLHYAKGLCKSHYSKRRFQERKAK